MSTIMNDRNALLAAAAPRTISVALPADFVAAAVAGPDYSLDASGLTVGDPLDPNAFIVSPAGDLQAGALTVVAGALVLAPFTASIAGGSLLGSGANGYRSYGSRTITPSGGTAPYTYSWVMANQDASSGYGAIVLTNSTTATVSAAGTMTDNSVTGDAVCTVTDSNGRTCVASIFISQTHGTP